MKEISNHEVSRSKLAGSILRLFGERYWAISLTDQGVRLTASSPRDIAFSELSGPSKFSKKLGFAAISVLSRDGELKVTGLNRAEALDFVSATNSAWQNHFTQQVDAVEGELNALAEVVERLKQPKRYPPACLVAPYLVRATQVLERLPDTIPKDVLPEEQQTMLDVVMEFRSSPEALRRSAIGAFLDADEAEMKDFYNTIESNPLTPEQRRAVATDEDATLVLAGAGSGKTSVIVAKAAYLIQRQIRQPEEILLMAFGKGAADEMAARIEERAGAKVDALTFHALGNSIIRQVENGAAALAAHASDDKQFTALLRDILFEDIAKQPVVGNLLLKWFSEFYWPYKSEWDFKSKDEYFQYVEAHELRSLQGDLVRSFEEWEIANWLYLNGIAYEYEPNYEHDLLENTRTAYTPDFKLTESGVYIEHFGVRKSRDRSGATTLTTAPHVDRATYLEGMEWKRRVHAEYETTLIETFSHERVEGNLTEALEEKLAPYAQPNPIPPEKVF